MRFLVYLLICLSAPTLNATTRSAQAFAGKHMMTVTKRTQLQFAALQPKALVVIQPQYQRTFSFDLMEDVLAMGIDETTDLIQWNTVYTDNPGLWIGFGHKQVSIRTNNQNAFYRAWVHN